MAAAPGWRGGAGAAGEALGAQGGGAGVCVQGGGEALGAGRVGGVGGWVEHRARATPHPPHARHMHTHMHTHPAPHPPACTPAGVSAGLWHGVRGAGCDCAAAGRRARGEEGGGRGGLVGFREPTPLRLRDNPTPSPAQTPTHQVGTDIDPLAVRAAQQNAALNGVQARLTALRCDPTPPPPPPPQDHHQQQQQQGEGAAEAAAGEGLFDVTVANILQASVSPPSLACAPVCRCSRWRPGWPPTPTHPPTHPLTPPPPTLPPPRPPRTSPGAAARARAAPGRAHAPRRAAGPLWPAAGAGSCCAGCLLTLV